MGDTSTTTNTSSSLPENTYAQPVLILACESFLSCVMSSVSPICFISPLTTFQLIFGCPRPLLHPYWCIHSPALNMPRPFKSNLIQLLFYGSNSYFLSDHLISYPVQSGKSTHPSDHSHLHYHQPLNLGLLNWLTLCSVNKSQSNYHTIDSPFQGYRNFSVT